MVTQSVRTVVITCVVLLTAVLVVSVLVPQQTDRNGVSVVGITLRALLASHASENGRYPSSLVDLEPAFIDSLGPKATIIGYAERRYRACADLNNKTHCLMVEYSVTGNGDLERYHVLGHTINGDNNSTD